MEKEIEKNLRRWQKILRLQDWDIFVRIVEAPWRKSGDIKIDGENKKAILLINRHPISENLEELVVHELVHLKLYAMDMMIEELINIVYGEDENDPKKAFAYTQFMTTLESTVEDLTKGLLSAVGSDTPLSLGRLKSEVEKEVGSGSQ